MFKFRKRQSLLFYQYLMSYMIIFLIPFTTISIAFYYMSINNLKTEITQSNISKLEQVKEYTDTRMQELRNIATRISYDNRLTPYMLRQPYASIDAVNQLSSFQVNSSIIDGLFLTYHGEELIYSQKGASTIEGAMSSHYKIKDIEKIKSKLITLSDPEVLPIAIEKDLDDQQHVISYLYPIPANTPAPYGTVMFFIKESTMKKTIQNILGDFTGNTYIFNGKNEIIVSKDVGEPLGSEYVNDFALGETGVIDKIINGENYSLVTVHSSENDWTYVTAMPTAQFYSKMSAMKTTILALLFLIALLGIGIAILITFKQYRPIQRLSQLIKANQSTNSSLEQKKNNELEGIRETIEFIFEDSEKLRKRIDLQQPFVRDQYLLGLLNHHAEIKSEINDLSSDLQIVFNGNKFFVVIVAFNEKIDGDSLQNREKIINLLTEIKFKDCIGYGVELIQENALVLIVSTEEGLEENRRNFAKELTVNLKGLCKVMPTIGVGKIYKGTDWINRSFIEATALVEHNLLTTKRDVNFFEDIAVSNENSFWYPINHQVQFTQSLKQGDQEVAKEAIDNIFRNLKEKNISTDILRSMCFDVINTTLKFISEFELPVKMEDVNELIKFNSVDGLEKRIHIMISNICKIIEKRKENNNNYLSNEIFEYIYSQFKSNDLSLANTAEEFQLSVSYLSRFIKDQTGTTFTQFVWKLRNAEFKRQLIETDVPIKNIVTDIGYVDVANFTRKFKETEGLTPGQYRKDHTSNNENAY